MIGEKRQTQREESNYRIGKMQFPETTRSGFCNLTRNQSVRDR